MTTSEVSILISRVEARHLIQYAESKAKYKLFHTTREAGTKMDKASLNYMVGVNYCLPICVKKYNSKPKIIASCMVVYDDILDINGNTIKAGRKYLLNAGHTFFCNPSERIYIHHPNPDKIVEIPRNLTAIDEGLDIAITVINSRFEIKDFATLQMQPLQELPYKAMLKDCKQVLVLQGFPQSKQKNNLVEATREIRDYPVEEIPPPESEDMGHNYLYAKFKHTEQTGIPSPVGISGGGTRRGYSAPDGFLHYEFVGINIGYNKTQGYVKSLKRESIVEFINNNIP